MMLVVTNAEGGLWRNAADVARLASTCAAMLRERTLDGALLPLPTVPSERTRCLDFAQSLRRAGAQRTVLVLAAATVSLGDLDACRTHGAHELIIRQGAEPPQRAFDVVAEYRRSHPSPPILLRVWIDPGGHGQWFRAASAWRRYLGSGADVTATPILLETPRSDVGVQEHGDRPSSAAGGEVTGDADGHPKRVDMDTRDDAGGAYRGTRTPLACEWIQNAVTVHPDGVAIPCPVHPAAHGVSLDDQPQRIIGEIARWPQVLGDASPCRHCSRAIRFVMPEWLLRTSVRMADPTAVTAVARSGVASYQDNVGGRLDRLDATEREAVIEALVERLRGAAAGAQGGEAR